MLSTDDLRRFHSGKLLDVYRKLGAHCRSIDGKSGVSFATWAPSARSVSLVGDFNDWDGRRHPMRRVDRGGVWELFVPEIGAGAQYKFEIHNQETGQLVIKTDPYARSFVLPSNTNAQVIEPSAYLWQDTDWLERRRVWRWVDSPINIYEVHLGSWRRAASGGFPEYEQLAEEISAHARGLHCTHVELLPIFEHPLVESLGYQVTGYFAPTSRFGSPDQFRAFVDLCHRRGLGVILDWVPLHFPKDFWALAEFDGGPLYERDDPNMAEHPRWRTLIFNYGRPEVRNFLLANALYWLLEFHIDGLRVDAVSSMLYLDDARAGLTWKTNPLGGRENLPAVKFLREMNAQVGEAVPDALMIAEESTSWPMVSQPAKRGGLGFSMKWNMGWVHDTLRYLSLPWEERGPHHRDLTFERLYARGERFVLALSHDEVVAPNGSLFDQMHGSDAQKFAGLRLLFTYQATYPGKKLNFMGNEFGRSDAWDPTLALPWEMLARERNQELMASVRDLGALYGTLAALHGGDFDAASFRWLDVDDAQRGVIAYVRSHRESYALVILNFSLAEYAEYILGVPTSDAYRLIFDSSDAAYGGTAVVKLHSERAVPRPWQGFDHSIALTLPALTGVVIAAL